MNNPEMYVISPDRRECYGAVRMLTEMSEDVRFNSCSELKFRVAEKVCDPLTGEWVSNPVFNKLEKNNLIFVCDNNNYFSFPNRTIRTDYAIKSTSNFATDYGRNTNSGYISMNYENKRDTGSNNGVLTGFELQPETLLYNISVAQGYNWQNLSDYDEFGFNKMSSWSTNFFKVACKDFVPIDLYDVISIRNRYSKNDTGINDRFIRFHFYFYTEKDANSVVGEVNVVYGGLSSGKKAIIVNPVARFSINSLTLNDGWEPPDTSQATEAALAEFKKKMANGGYFRVAVEDNYSTSDSASIATKRSFSSFYYTKNGTTWMGWSFPYDGWFQIYSGKRFCSKIENQITEGNHNVPLHWFVITDTENEYDGNICYKTVSAYSYEYTISDKSISLSENTIPFYIPQEISNIVNGDNWVIDKERGLSGSTARKSRQELTDGLLNQVLNILPDWSVGHISSELMTRYRKIDDADNLNLYDFLMGNIESLYQCYFVFNNDEKTISAYTQNDIIQNSSVVLNWQNALKSLKITDQDMNFMTALRVHTADDTYGIGLINPTGNSIIYNFDSVLDKLDFVADTSNNDPLQRNKITENGITRNRTLKEAVIALMNFINQPNMTVTVSLCTQVGDGDSIAAEDDSGGHQNVYGNKQISFSSLSQYRDNVVKKFIEMNLTIIKCKTSLSNYISEYESILSQIAASGEAKEVSYFKTEAIRKPNDLYEIRVHNNNIFVTEDLYNSIRNASKNYYQAKMEYEGKLNDYNAYLGIIKTVSAKTNLNYHNQYNLTNKYRTNNGVDDNGNNIVLSILTPAEILALQPFIREGDWTNDNSVFSEDYDAKDIVTTLIEAYNQAKNDMDLFISKPSYDFESDMINWTAIPEMQSNFKKLKVGKTLYINAKENEYVVPILLELHQNYKDRSDFSMKFTTDYNRKVYQLRFSDLYSTISQISAKDNTFNFAE